VPHGLVLLDWLIGVLECGQVSTRPSEILVSLSRKIKAIGDDRYGSVED
jgi:hypothetical protein